jgi:hypothetical protein
MSALHALAEARAMTPMGFFATEAEAWDMAARLADEQMTYVPAPYAGRYVLNAYDETGFWLGRL